MHRKTLQYVAVGVVLALLVVAQLVFGGRGSGAVPSPTRQTEPAPAVQDSAVPESRTLPPMEFQRIELGGTEDAPDIVMVRTGDGWSLEADQPVPADAAKVERLLDGVRNAVLEPAAVDGEGGFGPAPGYRVGLVGTDGQTLVWEVGLRPAGMYDRALIRTEDGAVAVIHTDLRGDLGLWDNVPDARPDDGHWVERRIFRFDPDEVLLVSATYPDHWVEFVRTDADASWTVTMGYIPGGEWSREGLAGWLDALSSFQAGAYAGDTASAIHGTEEPLASLTLTLADGEEKSLTVLPDHNGGAVVISSDSPDRRFFLPPWRYRRYFACLETIFPDAVPAYDLDAIRFIDVRRGGENAKLAHRDGVWRAAAIPFRIQPARVDRLARYLAGWKPEDYATPGIRPAYGGPMVEVTLSDGEVYQYRLAGRHPVLPWRYVVVNGYETFSIPDAEAAVMFPGFADILDLGLVLAGSGERDLARIEIYLTYDGAPDGADRLELLRDDDGAWSVGRDGERRSLTDEEIRRIVVGMFLWRVAGFQDGAGHEGDGPLCRLMLHGADGSSREITVFHPAGRDVPYRLGSDRGYLMERADFFSWYAAVGDLCEEFATAPAASEAEAEEGEAVAGEEGDAPETDREATVDLPEQDSLPSPLEDPVPTEEVEGGDGEELPDSEDALAASGEPETTVSTDEAAAVEGEFPESEGIERQDVGDGEDGMVESSPDSPPASETDGTAPTESETDASPESETDAAGLGTEQQGETEVLPDDADLTDGEQAEVWASPDSPGDVAELEDATKPEDVLEPEDAEEVENTFPAPSLDSAEEREEDVGRDDPVEDDDGEAGGRG